MPIENVTSTVIQAQARGKIVKTYADYYAGRHELKFASADYRNKYGATVGDTVLSIRENLCPAVVTAFTDGIEVVDWGTSAAQDTAAEEGMSRLEAMVNREAWKTGDAFVLVWPGVDGKPSASFQSTHAMVPHVDPLNPDQLDWCGKVWIDTARKVGRVNIYTPQGCERWETATALVLDDKGKATADLPEQVSGWQPCTDDEGDWIAHTFKVVPVCWFKREADSQEAYGTSILNDVVPLQDGLNKSLADLVVTSEAYARPFWYLLNVKPQGQPANPAMAATGLPMGPQMVTQSAPISNGTPSWTDFNRAATGRFDPNRQRIFTHDGPGPFGQMDPPDLTRLLQVQDGFALKVARVVGVPAYYFTQTSGDVPSGESLRVLSQRRTGRIKAWQRDAGPVWRGVKQLLGMGGGPVQWAPAIPLDEMERLQVASEKKALGYSLQDIVDYLGEADAAGIVQRAQASATDLARGFRSGQIGADLYGMSE